MPSGIIPHDNHGRLTVSKTVLRIAVLQLSIKRSHLWFQGGSRSGLKGFSVRAQKLYFNANCMLRAPCEVNISP
jgi:hypothetical protein